MERMRQMNAIEIKGLTKQYNDFRLGSFDLTLPAGSIMGLVGENGAGKSTTIKLITHAITADAGTISVLGVDNRTKAFLDVKEDIGVVLDEATSGLDPMVRDEILDIFNDFTREENHSILLSSHIISDLEKICDYVAFLHKGQLLLCDEKNRILEEYTMVRLSMQRLADLPEDSVIARRDNGYGTEALVHRSRIPEGLPTEHTTLEDIILFLAKGGNQS